MVELADQFYRTFECMKVAIPVMAALAVPSLIVTAWGTTTRLVIWTSLTVIASTDPRCTVGTSGHLIMYASYNGVRSDSMQFFFDSGCLDQAHLYHGPQVDAQVPPL